MPIQVTCSKCFKRFQVSDKFAGKSGPCPNCKAQIKVPDKSEEVVVHAPRDDAPKDSRGVSVLKPIKRQETDITRTGVALTILAVLAVFGGALAIRFWHQPPGTPLFAKVAGVVLLAPPLVWAGYQFVYDPEFEPYRGTELGIRVLILSAIFVAIWFVYAWAPAYVFELDRAAEMSYMTLGITLCVMLALGAIASVATFELEFFNGLIHAGLYFVATILLAIVSGVTLAGLQPAGP